MHVLVIITWRARFTIHIFLIDLTEETKQLFFNLILFSNSILQVREIKERLMLYKILVLFNHTFYDWVCTCKLKRMGPHVEQDLLTLPNDLTFMYCI